LVAACDYPEFHYRGESSGASPKTSNTSSSVSGAGDGGTGAQGGGGSAGVAVGGGGAGGCEIGGSGCPAGQKCTVVDITSGTIGCGNAGPKMAWQACNVGDVDCVVGTWCDARSRVCKPLCKSAAGCKFDNVQGECITALDTKGKVSNAQLMHCVPNCEPKEAKPCDVSGNVTCIRTSDGFDCVKSGGKGGGVKCASSSECAPGYVCVGSAANASCATWCRNPGSFGGDCGFGFCIKFDPPIKYMNKEYGSCG
jgi:hypothetical protein